MGLDIWFAEDIRNALLAANEASAATAAIIAEQDLSGPQAIMILRAYHKGYRAALVTVALAFGLPPQTIYVEPPTQIQGHIVTGERPHEP